MANINQNNFDLNRGQGRGERNDARDYPQEGRQVPNAARNDAGRRQFRGRGGNQRGGNRPQNQQQQRPRAGGNPGRAPSDGPPLRNTYQLHLARRKMIPYITKR